MTTKFILGGEQTFYLGGGYLYTFTTTDGSFTVVHGDNQKAGKPSEAIKHIQFTPEFGEVVTLVGTCTLNINSDCEEDLLGKMCQTGDETDATISGLVFYCKGKPIPSRNGLIYHTITVNSSEGLLNSFMNRAEYAETLTEWVPLGVDKIEGVIASNAVYYIQGTTYLNSSILDDANFIVSDSTPSISVGSFVLPEEKAPTLSNSFTHEIGATVTQRAASTLANNATEQFTLSTGEYLEAVLGIKFTPSSSSGAFTFTIERDFGGGKYILDVDKSFSVSTTDEVHRLVTLTQGNYRVTFKPTTGAANNLLVVYCLER